MITLEGKGFYIWKIPDCEGGDVETITELARNAQLSHVLIKVADGTRKYNYDFDSQVDLVSPLRKRLKQLRIQAWGWHYVYGNDPIGEARVAIRQVEMLELDGYVIDAESQYKQSGKKTAAKKFMKELRTNLPDTPIALSSYRYPSYHPQLPWREFLEYCDFNMPQVYWMFASNPGAQLARSVREFNAMSPSRPIIPTGAAFSEHGWTPKVSEALEFLSKAQDLRLSAANFWEWSAARQIPQMWSSIRDFTWPAGGMPKDICEEYIAALNSHTIDEVLGLYAGNAVHINAERTVQGLEALRDWYNNLFADILPQATFELTEFSGESNSRHFSWTAVSSQGKVYNGSDTFGLVDGKIVYHYTFFTVSPT